MNINSTWRGSLDYKEHGGTASFEIDKETIIDINLESFSDFQRLEAAFKKVFKCGESKNKQNSKLELIRMSEQIKNLFQE